MNFGQLLNSLAHLSTVGKVALGVITTAVVVSSVTVVAINVTGDRTTVPFDDIVSFESQEPVQAGPFRVERGDEDLQPQNFEFLLHPDIAPPYVLKLANGGTSSGDRVTSASVTLNGNEIISDADLSSDSAGIELPVDLELENKLVVSLAGDSDSFVDIQVVGEANSNGPVTFNSGVPTSTVTVTPTSTSISVATMAKH